MNNQTNNVEGEQNVINEQKPFFVYRKVIKCVSEGISFYTDNFVEFTIVSLPFVILLSLSSSFIPQIGIGSGELLIHPGSVLLQLSIFLLLTLLFTSSLISITFEYLKQRYIDNKTKITIVSIYRNINNSLPKVISYLLVTLVLGAIFLLLFFFIVSIKTESYALDIIKVMASCILSLFLIFVTICYNLVLPSVMFGEMRFFQNLWNGFKIGVYAFPKLLTASVFLFIVVSAISLLIFSPIYVMTMINNSAGISVLNGDAVNLPEGFSLSLFITYFISSLVFYYIIIPLLMPFVYLYVSAKVDKEERAKSELPLI